MIIWKTLKRICNEFSDFLTIRHCRDCGHDRNEENEEWHPYIWGYWKHHDAKDGDCYRYWTWWGRIAHNILVFLAMIAFYGSIAGGCYLHIQADAKRQAELRSKYSTYLNERAEREGNERAEREGNERASRHDDYNELLEEIQRKGREKEKLWMENKKLRQRENPK